MLALGLAAVGTSGVLSYVQSANTRAVAGLKAVSVLVAQRKIPSGTTAETALRNGMLADETLPASSVPSNALSSLTPDMFSLKLSAALPPGQLLLRPMLVAAAGAQLTSGMAIPPGQMAVTINFCLPEVVAGAVHPGSHVAVFDTVGSGSQFSAVPGCAGAHQQAAGITKTRMVLPRVLVLSVGTAAATGIVASAGTAALAPGGSSSSAGTLVTVAVGQADAERLIQLTVSGLPYLALLTPNSQTAADIGNLLNIPPKPKPVLTFPVVTPSPTPTLPAPAPTPSPTR